MSDAYCISEVTLELQSGSWTVPVSNTATTDNLSLTHCHTLQHLTDTVQFKVAAGQFLSLVPLPQTTCHCPTVTHCSTVPRTTCHCPTVTHCSTGPQTTCHCPTVTHCSTVPQTTCHCPTVTHCSTVPQTTCHCPTVTHCSTVCTVANSVLENSKKLFGKG